MNTAQNGHDATYQGVILTNAVFALQEAKASLGRSRAKERWGDLVGRRLLGHGQATFLIESYDSSHGFWIVNENDPQDRRDISERAIGRTFHLIDESPTHEEDRREVLDAFIRLLRIYEDDIEPVPRPSWVSSAVVAAERLSKASVDR